MESHLPGSSEVFNKGYKWFGHNQRSVNVKDQKGSGRVGFLIKDSFLIDYNVSILHDSSEDIGGLNVNLNMERLH